MNSYCSLCFNPISTISEPSISIRNHVKGKSDLLVSDLIRMHFPFYEKIFDASSDEVCFACYEQINEFHKYYETIASNYGSLESFDSKKGLASFDVGAEKQNIDESLIKIEKDEEEQNHGLDVNWMGDYERDILIPLEPCSSNSSSNVSSSSEDLPRARKKSRSKRQKFLSESLDETADDLRIRETASMTCEYCMEGVDGFREAKVHYMEEHGVVGYIICCGKKFKQKCRLIDHVNKHYDLSYECTVCQKSFDTKNYLLKHMACHEVEKQYLCDHCPKTFAKKFQVRNHLMSVHIYDNKEPEYACPLEGCGKKFVNQARLKHHIDYTHASEHSEICDICSKTFKTKHAVEEHRQIHFKRPEDRIKCEICGHYLSNLKTYKRHRKNHDTESMENTCSYCGKISPNLNALKKHIHYVHERVASFHCRYCEKSFKRARNLIDHEASVHTLQELYTCTFCPRTFRNQSNMLTHRKKMHPDLYKKPSYMRDKI